VLVGQQRTQPEYTHQLHRGSRQQQWLSSKQLQQQLWQRCSVAAEANRQTRVRKENQNVSNGMHSNLTAAIQRPSLQTMPKLDMRLYSPRCYTGEPHPLRSDALSRPEKTHLRNSMPRGRIPPARSHPINTRAPTRAISSEANLVPS